MKRLATVLASLLSIALSPAVIAQTSAFSITGIVISSTNGASVPHCRITATRIDNPANSTAPGVSMPGNGNNRNLASGGPRRAFAQQDSTVTDDRGHFTLRVAAAGTWALRATAT